MATELFRILIVSSILGYVLVDGNSAGAPFRCCEDGTNIVPEHLPNAPSTSPFPYSVSVESGSYTPGQNFDITLEGTTANENFKGFMIQGRLQADDSPIGNFNSTANYQTQCTGNTAATHTNGNEKTSVVLAWTPPPVGTGGIYFRLAMVDAFDTFWANIETSCISEDPQVSAGGTVSGNNFTITLNSAVDEVFNCSLDGGSFQPCSSGDMFPDLSVGSHTIDVQFTPSGSCEASVVQLTLNFDISPPFTLDVSDTIVGSKLTVDYTVSESATCTCQLDSDTAVPCDPGHMFTDIDPGPHTITVVCTSTSSGLTVTAKSAFSIAVQASASASIVGDTVTLTLDSNADGTFQCSVDGAAFVNCVSGQAFSGFTDGSHNIRVQFTATGSTDTISVRQLNFQIGGAFGLSVSAIYSDNDITVTFETSIDATCTCQLNSDPSVPCTSPHIFTSVSQAQQHSVTFTCTSTNDSSLVAQATVSGLQYLEVTVGLESTGTAIIVILEENIGASHRCRLDNGPFVECISGFQFNGISGGEHTVTVESTSTNGLTTATSTGTITVRGEDAILITDIETDVETTTKNYTFFFNINEKLPALKITLQIDGLPIPFPYQCYCITESRCYCTFINSGLDAYDIGPHVLTFISTLNGETRGTTNHQFLVLDVAVARFRDLTYDVVEGERIISVVVEKFGSSTQELTAFIRYNPGTARPQIAKMKDISCYNDFTGA